MTIAESFKRFRKEHGLTQAQVANALGVTQQAYQVYENKTVPTATVLIKISNAFGVSTDYLLGLSDEPKPAEGKLPAAPIDNSELVKVAEAFNELLQKVIANEKAAGGQ